jgi:hypothetical protein
MRTTIRLDDQLFKRVKKEAAETGRTFAAVVEDALRESLGRRARTADRPRVRLPTFGRGGLQPRVVLDDSADLRDIMDGR